MMKERVRLGAAVALVCFRVSTAVAAPAGEVLYTNDFQGAKLGPLPTEIMVLDGQFQVKEEDGQRFAELPGEPLETYGLLFGPAEGGELVASARIHGTAKGRRAPVFGVSLGGVGGYRLLVSPAKKQIELVRNDQAVVSAPFDWVSGKWCHVELCARKGLGDAWELEGRAWMEGGARPAEPVLKHATDGVLPQGRAGLWGSPFAGTAIRFDDLRLSRRE